MIGWSRRDAEARRRRRRWLESLTPEEREEEALYQSYVGRRLAVTAPACFVSSMALALLAYLLGFRKVSLGFEVASMPAALVLPFFLFIRTKVRWRERARR